MAVAAYNILATAKILVGIVAVFALIGTVRRIRKGRESYMYITRVDSHILHTTDADYIDTWRIIDPVSGGDMLKIAIGGAITSKGLEMTETDHVTGLAIFWQLLPNFCKTASVGYEYHFYFGYDDTDVLGNEEYLVSIHEHFDRFMARSCSDFTIGGLHMVHCNYTGKPAWAQNDAMMQAYLDGTDFFYRLNDDTMLKTTNWTETFIDVLAQQNPPFVGVVGPTCGIEPADIISHDFVHRTHIEIFGYYYPRAYADWFADTWITYVYKPGLSVKLRDVIVDHTEVMGRRYHIKENGLEMKEGVRKLAAKYSDIIQQ
jgi:hypothetical protein